MLPAVLRAAFAALLLPVTLEVPSASAATFPLDQGSALHIGLEGHWLIPGAKDPPPGDPAGRRLGVGASVYPAPASEKSRREPCPGYLRKLFADAAVAVVAIEWRTAGRCVSDWHPSGDSPPQTVQRLSRVLRAQGFEAARQGVGSPSAGLGFFHREDRTYTAQVWVHCLTSGCRVFASETTVLPRADRTGGLLPANRTEVWK